MKIIKSMNYGWKFRKESKMNFSAGEDYFDMFNSNAKTGTTDDVRGNSIYDGDWEIVDLPHDWNISAPAGENMNNNHGNRPQEVVWYRKNFTLGQECENKRVFLKFEAIAIMSEIWFNSIKVAESESGYTPIIVEITDFIEFGKQNIVSVKADNTIKEGWWYEGGGIYGNAELIITEQSFIKPYSVYIKPTTEDLKNWEIEVQTEIENPKGCQVTVEIPELGLSQSLKAEEKLKTCFSCENPKLWSNETPNLYEGIVTLSENGVVIDKETVRFGFRKVDVDSEKGCFINGERIKLNGVCIHHDFACVGVAVTKEIQKYRIKKLKEMGCNAIRTAHNPQLECFYDICDEMGIVVMDEVRHFSSTRECLNQLETFIKRDRNHPCVIMWSIFNEEPLQCTKIGEKIAKTMKRVVKQLDDSRLVCGGMNGPLEHEGVIKAVDIMGFNYIQYAYDKFHSLHPSLPIIGSETSSHMTTRGVTETDMTKLHLSCYSDVFNENLYAWSANIGDTWKYINERDFVMGGFDWTGFDYRGECGQYPAAVCNFGAMDLCGFPKDDFYWHKVIWENDSQIYLSPNKRYNKGESYKLACYSNCDRVVIKQKDKVLYDEAHSKYDRIVIDTVYNEEDIEAYGYNDGELCASYIQKKYTNGKNLVLECENIAYSDDVCIVNISVTDKDNIPVCDSDALVALEIEGGTIIGVGNGDNCFNGDETKPLFNLFNGLGQVVVKPACGSDKIILKAKSENLSEAVVDIPVVIGEEKEIILSENPKVEINSWRQSDVFLDGIEEKYISDLMFAWSPTTIGYGNNINFSGQKGYAEICGQISNIKKGANCYLVIENIVGKGDIYFNKEKVTEFNDLKDYRIKIDTNKYSSFVLSVLFKIDGDECGIPGNIYLQYEN